MIACSAFSLFVFETVFKPCCFKYRDTVASEHPASFAIFLAEGRPTKLQEATIRKILAAGGTALVVRSVDEVRAVVNGSLH